MTNHELFVPEPYFPKPEILRERPPNLRRVCSVSTGGGVSMKDFFSMLRYAGVTAVIDTRLSREFRGARFTHGEDFEYACELHQIEYVVGADFSPTQQMREEFARTFKDVKKAADRDPRAWTTFLQEYEKLMQDRQPLKTELWRELEMGQHRAVALLCNCPHHDDCHRSYATGMIARYIEGVELEVLTPHGKKPRHFSPRRYRLEDFVHAELRANKR